MLTGTGGPKGRPSAASNGHVLKVENEETVRVDFVARDAYTVAAIRSGIRVVDTHVYGRGSSRDET